VNNDLKDYYVLLNAKPFSKTEFIDTLPKNARNSFLYKIAALDSSLNRSLYSAAVRVQMPDVTPPVQPVIMDAGPKDDYLSVEWIPNKEPDLAGYELFRTQNNAQQKVKVNAGLLSPSVTRFTDRTIVPDTIYNYTLVAVDSAGNHSSPSQAFPVVFPHTSSSEKESEIIKFSVKQPLFSKAVKLQWSAQTGSSFIGYTIYKRLSPNDNPQKLTNLITDNSVVDRAKNKPGVQYQLRLYHKTGRVIKSQWLSKDN